MFIIYFAIENHNEHIICHSSWHGFFRLKMTMTSSADADSQVEEVSQRVKEAEESVAKVPTSEVPRGFASQPQKNGAYVVVEHELTMKNRN